MENLKGFLLSILGIGLVLAIGFIVLGQLNATTGVAPTCQSWLTADANGTTACQHYECVNNTIQTLATPYTLNSTRENCYNATNYGAMNSTQLVSNMPAAYNTTAGVMSNMSSIPNWIGILLTVALAFIVLGYFYKKEGI